MTETTFDQIKEIATGMYARRLCGAGLIDGLARVQPYQGDFNFDWVNECDIPQNSHIQQHEAGWERFRRDLGREWTKYVNSQGR